MEERRSERRGERRIGFTSIQHEEDGRIRSSPKKENSASICGHGVPGHCGGSHCRTLQLRFCPRVLY